MDKPVEMFDRDFEWSELSRFVQYAGPEPTLGVISGRRRQGKTFLLDAVARATGGFMFTATETTQTDSLRQFGDALARYVDEPSPFRFDTWDAAIGHLMRLATDRPTTVVLDEFPFLAKASPALPSIIQRELDPGARATNTPVRMLLCGSAMSFMGRLLSGTAPLRGRAGLELVVPTLDYRLAADFWEIDDPRAAALTHAVVGGTPAYRREFSQGDTPTSLADVEPWIIRAVLNPGRPLFREGRYLLAEEPELQDVGLYHSVLAAIATGSTGRGAIADYLGRKSTDLAHPLAVLEDVGLIRREDDAFRNNRPTFRIAEPLLTFYHAIIRPNWGDLERPGRASHVWKRVRPTFFAQVMGPHFEDLCREWTRWYASPETLGGFPRRVAAGVVNDPAARTSHQLDLAVFGESETTPPSGDQSPQTLLAIGEAKWSATMDTRKLARLAHIRDVLVETRQAGKPARDDSGPIRLMLFGGAGFTDELREAAASDNSIQLIDLQRLYDGD